MIASVLLNAPHMVFAVPVIVSNQISMDSNVVEVKNMMMPGGNMTFGSSLENAKMHLMEALMDLKNGDTKGAAMQLNMTDQAIKLHERELESMMLIMKRNNMTSSSEMLKSDNRSTMMS
ncbi:MAG: hypothetical protein M3530_08325 [Thermoproteota archaeon]|nr:hypothetical protein [Thermoproteota archaeon]